MSTFFRHGVQHKALWLCSVVAMFLLTGCPPDFQDTACDSDTDCFEDQVCSANQCVKKIAAVPEITAFTIDKTTIAPGTEITLSWDTVNADSATISSDSSFAFNVPAADLATGSTTTTLDKTTKFTFSVTGGQLSATKEIVVEVQDVDAPVIDTFTAQPTTIKPGEMTTLSWTAKDASTGKITYDDKEIALDANDLATGSTSVALDKTTTFTLTMDNVSGTDTKDVAVTVMGDPPSITAFASDKATINEGEDVILNWTIENADSVELVDDEGTVIDVSGKNVAQDTLTLSPTKTTAYTLTAINVFGMQSNTVNVVVNQLLGITSFDASETSIRSGDPVDLSWVITGTPTSVVIKDDLGDTVDTSNVNDLNMATVSVNPLRDSTYTLTTTDGTETKTAMVTVTLLPDAPAIADFSAAPEMVQTGATTTLSWVVTDATSLALVDDLGATIDVTNKDVATDSIDVTVDANRTYTLTATNTGGSDARTVTVMAGDVVVVNSFATSATDVVEGDDVTLSWDISNASSLRLTTNTGQSVDLTGKSLMTDSIVVTPAKPTTTYTLIAEGFGGPAAQAVSVNVADRPLTINTFEGAPLTIQSGQTSTLTWAAVGATGATLSGVGASGMTNVDLTGKDPNSDSIDVSPTEDTVYTFEISNGVNTMSATVSVTVFVPAAITSFDAAPTVVPENGTATLTWVATNATGATLSVTDASGTTSIDITGKDANSDSIDVVVTEDSTFTFDVTGAQASTDTATTSVTVTPAVTIATFEATPPSVLSGAPSTLSWTTSNATALTLTATDGAGTTSVDIAGKMNAADTVTVNPTQDTTYTLSATDGVNTVTMDATVTISGLAVNSFNATPNPIEVNQTATLTWTANSATTATLTATNTTGTTSIDISAKTAAGDSVDVVVTEDTVYDLTVSDGINSVSETLSVTTFALVAITTFSADKMTTVSGEAVVLSWDVSNATSLTLTDDLGNNIDISALDLNQDSITLNPQASVVYTLTANGQNASTDTRDVSITVNAAKLLITEFLVNSAGGDNEKEWVEIYNNGDTFVDLSEYSLANGGSDWTYSMVNLTGTIAPGGCAVIGGPISDGDNANPVYTQTVGFSPNFQNGGATADGVGLFFTKLVTNTSVPIDAVLYGTTNDNNLIGEDGLAKTEISVVPGSAASIERVSELSDVFTLQTTPTPGQCFNATQLNTTRSPNDATGQLEFDAFGVDLNLMDVSLDGVTLNNCTELFVGHYGCDVAASATAGSVDFAITQTMEYAQDVNGQTITQPKAMNTTQTLIDAFYFEGRLDDPGADFYCGIVDPGGVATANAGSPIDVDVDIYVLGNTEAGGDVPAGWIVEAAYFDRGLVPYSIFGGLTWSTATKNGNQGNNAIYRASLTSPTPSIAEAGYRISPDGGLNYYYCDRTGAPLGSDNGWDVNGGLALEWTIVF